MMLPHLPDLVISDLHLGHARITEYCFRDNAYTPTPEDVDNQIVASWNHATRAFRAVHGRDPVILHLGDLIGWKSSLRAQDDRLLAMEGDKYTFRGNHDAWPEEWIEEHDFKLVEPFSFRYDGFLVIMSHYPERSLASGELNIHGHTHNNPFNSASRAHRNVSVECVSYMPRPLKALLDSTIRLVTTVPDHIDYNADELARARSNRVELGFSS